MYIAIKRVFVKNVRAVGKNLKDPIGTERK